MISLPATRPVTVPPATLALELLLLHVPVGVASVNTILELVQTFDKPLILPASGNGLTKTDLEA
jgi:hypothetical protein